MSAPPLLPNLAVVIPAFNEADNLAEMFREAEAELAGVAGHVNYLFVDDGSTDDTHGEMMRLAAGRDDVKVLRHAENMGLGAAIWTGVGQAGPGWCTWLPADSQVAPVSLVRMAALAAPDVCVVLVRPEVYASPWRRFLTEGLRLLLRAAASFDLQNYSGVFLAPGDLLRTVPFCGRTTIQNYAVPIVLRDFGVALRQADAEIRRRRHGQSKVANIRTITKTFFELFVMRARIRRIIRKRDAS